MQRAAEQSQAFLHPADAQARALSFNLIAPAIILNAQNNPILIPRQAQRDMVGTGMARNIGQTFLGHAKKRGFIE